MSNKIEVLSLVAGVDQLIDIQMIWDSGHRN